MTQAALSSVRAQNFTVFGDLNLKLASGLNVIVGENGAGKSHLLKLLYATVSVSYQQGLVTSDSPRKGVLQQELASKLVGVFRPESLGRLVRRRQGRSRSDVVVAFEDRRLGLAFDFASNAKSEVNLSKAPSDWVREAPAFLPTRELLTIYPGFVSLYENRALEFEETWRDTCLLLGLPLTRGPRASRVKPLLEPIEQTLGGTVVDENARFYLKVPGEGSFEMPLVAEGLRKIAMLARLISTGTLLDSGYLFWDEPESNLNPKVIKGVAESIVQLANSGVQVFLGTHSLFLLRELEILLNDPRNSDTRERSQFIGLAQTDDGVIATADRELSGIGDIASLDESLMQSDRYLEVDFR